MLKKTHVFALVTATAIAIAPNAVFAQQAPVTNQPSNNNSDITKTVTNAITNAVIQQGIQALQKPQQNPQQNPVNQPPNQPPAVVGNGNNPIAQPPIQPNAQQTPQGVNNRGFCGINAELQVSVQELNPFAVVSGIASTIAQVAGQGKPPNLLNAASSIGCK